MDQLPLCRNSRLILNDSTAKVIFDDFDSTPIGHHYRKAVMDGENQILKNRISFEPLN